MNNLIYSDVIPESTFISVTSISQILQVDISSGKYIINIYINN